MPRRVPSPPPGLPRIRQGSEARRDPHGQHLLARATAPRLLALQPYSGGRRCSPKPLRTPRRVARNPRRLRFHTQGSFAPTDATVQGESYFDPHGPLSKEWRDGDSVWSLVAGDRLDRALSRLRKLDQRGELESYVARNDALRSHIGQATIVCVPKIARQGFEPSGVCARLTSSLQSFEHITGVWERLSKRIQERSTIGEIVCRARTRAPVQERRTRRHQTRTARRCSHQRLLQGDDGRRGLRAAARRRRYLRLYRPGCREAQRAGRG